MAAKQRELIEDYLQCYNSRDIEGMVLYFAEHAVYEFVSNALGVTRTTSRSALKAYALANSTLYEYRRITPTAWVDGGDHWALETEITARLAHDINGVGRAGDKLALRGASFFTIGRAAIERLIEYS